MRATWPPWTSAAQAAVESSAATPGATVRAMAKMQAATRLNWHRIQDLITTSPFGSADRPLPTCGRQRRGLCPIRITHGSAAAASAASGGRLQPAVRPLEIPRLPQGRNHFSAGDPRETSHATVLFFTPTSTSDRKPHLRSSCPCQGAHSDTAPGRSCRSVAPYSGRQKSMGRPLVRVKRNTVQRSCM